jgi:N-acetylneuraminic acid mutarotase
MFRRRTPRRAWPGRAVVWAAVLAAIFPVLAVAAPVSASAAGVRPAAAVGGAVSRASARAGGTADSTATAPAPTTGAAPVRRACPTPKPGYAACDALIRTDAAGHQGMLAAGVTPLGYGPADLQSAYALPSATAGKGATVAIVDAYDDPTAESDLAAYRSQYGLPPCTTANGCFRKVNQDGGSEPPTRDAGWAEEISLDLDMVSAACPNCHILLVEADDDSVQNLGIAENEAVALGAKYVSNSYGTSPLDDVPTAELQQWDTAYYDHPGVVITAATGDDGWNGYQSTEFPASSPHVVAVGGTTLTRDPSSPRGWSESVWEDTGGGSGCSGLPQPSWQTLPGPTGRADCGRVVADVSADADPDTGVAVYDTYGGVEGWTVIGGTSAATPLIAAVYALAGTPVGGTYPASYLYANPSALNGVSTGNNWSSGDLGNCITVSSNGQAFWPAYMCNGEPGYNAPSGLGTPEGVAAFQAGPLGEVTGTVRDTAGRPLAGITVSIGSGTAITDAHGRYATTALDGSYSATAAEFGYASQSVSVTVASGATATADFTLSKDPTATVSGTVTDASGHGWPLYAQVQVPGTPVSTYTNPVTGRYQVTLPVTGAAYTLDASAVYPGYQAGTASVTPATAGASQDFGLTVDPMSNCAAPGYQPVYNGYRQTFSTGTTPAGWTLSNFAGDGGVGWVFDNPQHLRNDTGGSGGFAYVTGIQDYLGATMTTQPLDLSGDQDPVLQFDTNVWGEGDVWVSPNGGQSWTTVFSSASSDYPTGPVPTTETIPLPASAAGQPDVLVRFLFSGDYQEVDNIFVGELSCAPTAGGLVVGQVRDRNTGQPVDGAQVSVGGAAATTVPAPDDPAVGGGLYWLFSGAGTQALAASAPFGYSPAAADVTVTGGAVTRADLTLAAPRLALSPGRVAGAAATGSGAATEHLTVANTGSAPTTVTLDAQQGPFTVAGQPTDTAAGTAAETARAAAGPPLRTVAGHFGPGLPGKPDGPAVQPAAVPSAAGLAQPGGGDTSWVPVAHFPEDVYDDAAAEDPATGQVYVVGGVNTLGVYLASAEAWMFSPASGTWTQLPDMASQREAPAAAFIGGKLYVTGGADPSDVVNQTALEIYDPRTGQWSAGAPVPHAYYGSATAVLDGKMYVIGGCDINSQCRYRNVQVYDPATNTWAQAAPYPRPISFGACGGIGGKLYCAGGYDNNLGHGTAAAYVYNPQANAWSPIASMPIDLWGGAYAAANGQLLVSGGVTSGPIISGFGEEVTNQGFTYNPATSAWTPLPNAADTVYRGGSACGLYQVGGIAGTYESVYAAPADTAQQLPGYGGCDGGAGVPWLSLSHSQLTLAPGQRATVTVTLNAADPSVSQPGTYTATLTAEASTPYLSPVANVALAASPPRTWGELSGTVEGKACDGSTAALAGVAVQIDSAAGSWTLTTDTSGQYAIWLDAGDSPLTLIATDPDYLAQAVTASLTARKTTTVNLTLSQAGC